MVVIDHSGHGKAGVTRANIDGCRSGPTADIEWRIKCSLENLL